MIIKNTILLRILTLSKKARGIALWPFIVLESGSNSPRRIRHEKIHLRQQLEMLVIPFYIWYFVEFVIKFFKYGSGSKAYRNIGFEQEAYMKQDKVNYLNNRTRYFWFHLI